MASFSFYLYLILITTPVVRLAQPENRSDLQLFKNAPSVVLVGDFIGIGCSATAKVWPSVALYKVTPTGKKEIDESYGTFHRLNFTTKDEKHTSVNYVIQNVSKSDQGELVCEAKTDDGTSRTQRYKLIVLDRNTHQFEIALTTHQGMNSKVLKLEEFGSQGRTTALWHTSFADSSQFSFNATIDCRIVRTQTGGSAASSSNGRASEDETLLPRKETTINVRFEDYPNINSGSCELEYNGVKFEAGVIFSLQIRHPHSESETNRS